MNDDLRDGLRTQLSQIATRQATSLRAERDPYRLLVRLDDIRWWSSSRAHGVAAAMAYYADFVTLAASYPAADQDALVAIASRVFAVRVRTLRADLARAAAASLTGARADLRDVD